MKGKRMYFVFISIVLGTLSSCTVTHEILLGDVISFGDSAITNYHYQKGKHKNLKPQGDPYVLFSPTTHSVDAKAKFQMMQRIYNTQMENNTAGIYAMNLGLDRIEYIRKHHLKNDPNARYYIIYMTDGLDNISHQVAKNNKQGNYKTPEKYKEKMMKKIAKVSGYKKKSQNPFDIYPVVFTGTDLDSVKHDNHLTDAQFDQYINNNMGWLRGSSRGPENAPRIIHGKDFDVVLEAFKDEFYTSGFEFHVPKGYIGKGIRMKINGYTSKRVKGQPEVREYHQTELTGTLVKQGNKYYLRGIQLRDGLESDVEKKGQNFELKAINNKDKEAELTIFRLERPKYNGKPYFIERNNEQDEKEYVAQYVNDGGMWVKNSEYISQSKGTVDTYFVLIFDASKSLKGEGFAKEKETAMEMINVISNGLISNKQKVDKIESNK